MNIKNSTQKGFVVPVVTALAVLLIAGGVYWGMKSKTPANISTITVISPNGGETYKIGQNISIEWSPKNIAITKIQLWSSDAGVTGVYGGDLETNTAPILSGHYDYVIPAGFVPSTWFIRIMTADGQEISSKKFTVNIASSTTSTSEWKTYSNGEYNFQYPSNWNIGIHVENGSSVTIQSPDRQKYFMEKPDGSLPLAEIGIGRHLKGFRIEDAFNLKSKQIIFNGMKAIESTYDSDGPETSSILIDKGLYTYEIAIELPTNEIKAKILNSFKFTN